MYKQVKLDLERHETMSYELANAFENQFDVTKTLTENIKGLKMYALVNDAHMETFLPL